MMLIHEIIALGGLAVVVTVLIAVLFWSES